MKATFLLLTLAAAFASNAEAQVSLDLNTGPRPAYEALADKANLNVVFPRPLSAAQPVAFRADRLGVSDALDLLAKQTSTFWVPWDKKTILVLEDNLQNRRDYERQFLVALPLGNKSQSGVIEELRGRGIKGVAIAGPDNTVFVRDTAAQIRLAESLIANPNASPAVLDLEGVFLADNGAQWRTPESARSQLKIRTVAPVSMNVDESSRTTFETLAKSAGVNVLFSPVFRPTNVRFAVKDVAFSDALDLLSIATRTFWQPINENTIQIFDDNQQNRRDYEVHTAETIYLPAGTSTTRLYEILNNLRTILTMRGVFQYEPANAIFIHDTPARVVLAETMIETMTGAPLRKNPVTDLRTRFSANRGGSFHTAASDRANLQLKVSTPISFSSTGDVRDVFDRVASTGGLQVVFKANLRPRNVSFSIQDVDVIEALDFLALQSGMFWQPLDARTIMVIEDNQQNRRDLETHLIKTIYLPSGTTAMQMNGILNVLRTAIAFRGVFQNEDARAIVIHDTPQRMALAETIIEHLNTHPTPSRGVDIPAPRYAENNIYGYAASARPLLKLKSNGSVTISLNQTPRVIYEAIGDMAGLNVTFPADFPTGSAARFQLEGVDALDALDYLSLSTGNSWKVVDAQTVVVLPGNSGDVESPITKTVHISNNPTQSKVNGIGNLLRTAMGMRGVQIDAGSITLLDTPQRVAIAERIISSLDQVR
jgi:hypothetical protein